MQTAYVGIDFFKSVRALKYYDLQLFLSKSFAVFLLYYYHKSLPRMHNTNLKLQYYIQKREMRERERERETERER